MGRTNYFRLFAMLAFVVLAAMSCKWTAESLYMWHPDLTIAGAWAIAVFSFVIASLCFSQLLRALDRNEDFYGKLFGRGGAFAIGLFGLVFFWMCVSLHTNTHTLLYGANIKTVMTQDISRTKGYLTDLKDNNQQIKAIEADRDGLANLLSSRLQSMQDEIIHPSHEGIGYRFNSILTDVERILTNALGRQVKITRAERVGSTPREWNRTFEFYQAAINANFDIYSKKCDEKIRRVRQAMNDNELKAKIQNLSIAQEDINDMTGVNPEVIKAASNDLIKSYSYIKRNEQYLEFHSDEDKARYTAENLHTDAENLLNVEEVVRDYAKTDKYKGMSYWILIAILVDIAGFVFFNIAFSKKNNNALSYN